MKHRLDCRIVQDLLPSYVDGLTCEYTNQEVEAHVAECLECADLLKRMQAPEAHVAVEAEVNYMKKIQNRMSKWKAASGTFAVLVISLLILGVVLYNRIAPKEFEDVFGFEEDELATVEITDTTTFSQSKLDGNELEEFVQLLEETEFYYERRYKSTFEGYAYLISFADEGREHSNVFHITDRLYIYYEGKEYSVRNDEELLSWIMRNVLDKNTYKYPNAELLTDWGYMDILEMRALCEIPECLLKNMSDEELILATLDFPYIMIMFTSSAGDRGVKVVEEECGAYRELISRESALESLLTFVEKRKVQFANGLPVEEEMNNEILSFLILYQEKFQEQLTEEDREFVEEFSKITNDVE